jgi:hypothetical protein
MGISSYLSNLGKKILSKPAKIAVGTILAANLIYTSAVFANNNNNNNNLKIANQIQQEQVIKENKNIYSKINNLNELIKILNTPEVVSSGSCLSKIAYNISHKYNIKLPWSKLQIANNIKKANEINVGDKLILPEYFKTEVINKYNKLNSNSLQKNSEPKISNYQKRLNSREKRNIEKLARNTFDYEVPKLENYIKKKESPIQILNQNTHNTHPKSNLEKNISKITLSFKKNETLYGFSMMFNVSYNQILKNNPHITDIENIKKGTSIDFIVEPHFKMHGYTINKHEKNRLLAKTKTGEEIEKDRKRFGIEGFSKLLDITPGKSGNLDKYLHETNELAKDHVTNTSIKYNIDPKIIWGMLYQENGGLRTKNGSLDFIMSKSGCLGAMQQTSTIYGKRQHSNGKVWESINPFNLEESIDRAGKYYDLLLKKYKSKILAITAYNTGENVVDRAITKIRTSNPNGKKSIWDIVYAKNDNDEYFISKEGRNYYRHVQQKIKKYHKLEKYAMN